MRHDGILGAVPARRARTASAGFSLVELTVAIGVMLIAIIAALSSQLTSAGLIRTSQESNTALVDLEACMEQIKTLTTGNIPVPGSPFEQGRSVAAFDDLHLQNEQIIPTYPEYALGGPVPDPLTIILDITWDDYQGRQRQLTLRSMKVR